MKDFEDDDFGELYADVELQAGSAISSLPAEDQLPQNEELIAQLTVRSPSVSTQFDKDSDTDDELNIVLNDEDYDSAGRNGGGSDDVNIECAAEMPKRSCELAYTHGSTQMGLVLEDDGDYYGKDVRYSAVAARPSVPASSMLPQVGHNFFLPWGRSIFDVNIDSFREKPWMYHGADITDFFNFGLDEASWKIYCNSLEQLRQHKSLRSTMFPVSESSQSKKVNPEVEHGNPVQEVMANGTLKCLTKRDKKFGQLIVKGRAIEVEESLGERQPSMVFRHVPSSSYDDSDVVIQIPLQDCPVEPSGAGKEEVGCLQHEISSKYEKRKIYANEKEMAADGPEEHGRSELPIPERLSAEENVSKLLDPDSHRVQINSSSDDGADHISQNSEINAEPRRRIKEINEGIYEGVSAILENEVSQMEQEKLSLSSSLFESDTEASEFSASVDLEKHHTTPKRSPLRSCDESEDSFAKDYDDSTINGDGMKSAKWKDYSSDRSMIKRETSQNWRLKDSIGQKNYALDDYGASPVSHSKGISDWRNSQGGCKQQNVSRHDFNHSDRECSSPSYYNSKRGCVDERLADNRVQAFRRGSSYRKVHSVVRDDMDPYFRRKWKKREMSNSESYRENKGERDYGSFRESKWSKGWNSYPPYSSTRQFESNFLSYTSKDDSPSRMDTEDNHFKEKCNQAGRSWDHRYEDNLLQDRHGTYVSSRNGEQGSLWKSYSREIPRRREITFSGRSERHIRRPPVMERLWAIEPEYRPGTYLTSRDSERGYFGKSYSRQLVGHKELINSGRSERHRRGPLFMDEPWVTEPEDGYEGFVDCEPLPHHPFRVPHEAERTLEASGSSREGLYDSITMRRYGKSLGYKVDNRTGSSAYSEVYELGDAIAYPDGGIRLERTKYTKQSKVLHLSKSGLTSRHGDDKFQTQAASVFPRRNSKYAVHHKYESLDDGMFEDDMQAQQHNFTILREESDAFHVNKGFHVVDRIQDDQKKPFSTGSIDLYVRDGKASRRAHKRSMVHTANPESNKEAGTDTTRTEGHEVKSKWIDKFPIVELDIEEGQSVVEVSIPQKMLEPRKATERKEGVDEKRVLETLAKMERRRERFKEAGCEAQFQVKMKTSLSKTRVMEEAIEAKFQRPARKRRWCGS